MSINYLGNIDCSSCGQPLGLKSRQSGPVVLGWLGLPLDVAVSINRGSPI